MRLADSRLEGREVDLAQGALVHFRADAEALELLLVGEVMLDAGADALTLQPGDVGDGHARGQVGVFGEALEVAAAQRRAVDVDGGAEQHLRALGFGLLGQRLPDALDQRRVPGRGQHGPGGEGRRRHAAGEGVAPRPVRAVGHLQRRNTEPLDGDRMPRIGAGQQRDLLFERQLRQ